MSVIKYFLQNTFTINLKVFFLKLLYPPYFKIWISYESAWHIHLKSQNVCTDLYRKNLLQSYLRNYEIPNSKWNIFLICFCHYSTGNQLCWCPKKMAICSLVSLGEKCVCWICDDLSFVLLRGHSALVVIQPTSNSLMQLILSYSETGEDLSLW